MKTTFALSLLLLLASPAAQAQSPTSPTATATSRPIVLKAAHLFDGRSGRLESPGVLVVQGKQILAVGPGAVMPAGAEVIELGDATLVPGFIDAHVHLVGEFNADWAKGFYTSMLRLPVEESFYAEANAKRTLKAGFTTVRNVGAPDFIDIALRNAITAGLVDGPRILAAGNALGSPGGHCDSSPFPPERVAPLGPLQGVCSGPEECRKAVRYQMKWGADVIKICSSGGVLSESDPVDVPQLTPAELTAIISEAHAWRRKVAAHSHGDLAARQAIDAGVDSIEHGSFLSTETLQLMKTKGVYLVPTRMTLNFILARIDAYPPVIADKARAAGAVHAGMFKNALRLGVPIAFGTDAGVFPNGDNAREFGDMVDLGMAPSAALLSSSRGAAILLGVDKETGTLEAGKFADVVAVPGDVLANIRVTEKPLLVMNQGKLVLTPKDKAAD